MNVMLTRAVLLLCAGSPLVQSPFLEQVLQSWKRSGTEAASGGRGLVPGSCFTDFRPGFAILLHFFSDPALPAERGSDGSTTDQYILLLLFSLAPLSERGFNLNLKPSVCNTD